MSTQPCDPKDPDLLSPKMPDRIIPIGFLGVLGLILAGIALFELMQAHLGHRGGSPRR